MTIEQDPLAHEDAPGQDETTRVVRASSADTRANLAAPPPIQPSPSPVITAELPAYRAAPPHVTHEHSRYTEPRPPGRTRHRAPAPVGIRLIVWVVAFICLVALVALATVHVHPTWLSFLRNAHPNAAATTSTPAGGVSSTHSTKFALSSSKGSTITYAVPASSFSVVVNPITDAYVTVKAPPTAAAYTFVGIVSKTRAIAVPTTAAVVVARQCRSIVIESGSKILGTVPTPRLGVTYIFTAEGS